MFQRRLSKPLIFGYPFAASRLFHTFFCPPLRIAAYAAKGTVHDLEKVFDRLVPPWRFVRIPKALYIVEVNPGNDLPEESVKAMYEYESGQVHLAGVCGAWEATVSLNSLLLALFAQSVADMRRVHKVYQKRGVVELDVMREQFPVWMRGKIADSAGFLMDFAGVYDVPRPAFSLARQVLQAENPFLDEILAAGIAGVPWQRTSPTNVCAAESLPPGGQYSLRRAGCQSNPPGAICARRTPFRFATSALPTSAGTRANPCAWMPAGGCGGCALSHSGNGTGDGRGINCRSGIAANIHSGHMNTAATPGQTAVER